MRALGPMLLVATSAVACVTIPDSPRKLEQAGGSAGSAGSSGSSGSSGSAGAAGVGGVPIPDSGDCPSSLKPCGELCVPISDPAYGCGTTGCDPCPNVDRATGNQCASGACTVASCQTGFGDCNGAHGDGCEHDTSADPLNCGACDWDCGGTTCAGGSCSAKEIIKGLHSASDILIDDASVYVPQLATPGLIVTAKDGTPKTAPDTGWIMHIAQDATHLYLGSDTELRRWAKAGGAVQVLTPSKDVDAIAVDDSYVWFAQWQASPALAQVFRASKTTPGASTEVHSQATRIRHMLVDGTTLYFTDTNGTLNRMPVTGGAVDTMLDYGSNAWGLTLHGGMLYWRGADAVLGAPETGTTASLLFPGQGSPGGIAAADQRLFWTTGSIVVTGDPATKLQRTLASMKSSSRGIAVDAEFVYWTTFTAYGDKTGGAFRVRRPPP